VKRRNRRNFLAALGGEATPATASTPSLVLDLDSAVYLEEEEENGRGWARG
jgi:hypothetical protein